MSAGWAKPIDLNDFNETTIGLWECPWQFRPLPRSAPHVAKQHGWRASTERQVQAPIPCTLPDPERPYPERRSHNSFTINRVGQCGPTGTSLARENRLHLTGKMISRRKSQNNRTYEIQALSHQRRHPGREFRMRLFGPSRWRGISRTWGKPWS